MWAPEKITVTGLGLIGGSLCKAAKRRFPGVQIAGVDFPDVVQQALQEGVIHRGYGVEELEAACAGADLVFVAVPISAAMSMLSTLARVAPPGAVVSDVCSLKAPIVKQAEVVFRQSKAAFVGGHPMAGAEKPGLPYADPFLFENAIYVVSPLSDTPQVAVNRLSEFLHRLGAQVILLDADVHDQIAATVSHLPQVLAVALMNFVAERNRLNPLYLKMAAGGFRDMTRIASSPYHIWKDIIQGNRRRLAAELSAFIDCLQDMRRKILDGDLAGDFERAARNRLSIPKDTRGFMHPHFDISVQVEDRPGVIAAIATTLAEAQINIKDIEVLKVRENEGGTLRLAFESGEVRRRAVELLATRGFVCHERDD